MTTSEGDLKTTSFVLQPFSEKDMDETDIVLRAAYRTQYGRKDTLKRYLEIQPSHAIVAREGEEIVGFGATRDYGPFAYIGLMAAHPKVQGRGAGRMILEEILGWLSSRQSRTILLDASPSGVHLYETHGFVRVEPTLVLQRSKSAHIVPDPSFSGRNYEMGTQEVEGNFAKLVSFDEPFFGANRDSLLRSYYDDEPQRFLVSKDMKGRINGFLVAQARTLGPWVVKDSKAAEDLLAWALEFPFEDRPSVIVSGSNKGCLDLLGRYGFEVQRSMQHMYWGVKPIHRARSTAIYAQATAGFG